MQQKYKERHMKQQKKKSQAKETPFGNRRSTYGGRESEVPSAYRESVTSEKRSRRNQNKLLGHHGS